MKFYRLDERERIVLMSRMTHHDSGTHSRMMGWYRAEHKMHLRES